MTSDTEQNVAAHESETTWLLSQRNDSNAATGPLEQQLATSAETSIADTTLPGTSVLIDSNHNSKYAKDDSEDASAILAHEAKRLVKSSTPVALTYLLQYSFTFINMFVLGHIGSDELAASGLINMAIIVVVYSPAIGLSAALDTYCSTAYTASRDKKLVGFHLQRGIIAVSMQFLCIAPLLWYLEDILVWLNQDLNIAMLCGRFMRVFIAGALPWMCFECVKRFLQAQEIMHASTYILVAAMPIHIFNNYLLVWSPFLGFGFLGAAVANVFTNWFMLIALIIYVRYSTARDAWGGWTIQAFTSMPQYFQLALPSMIMVCAEWWILDLLALASSYLGSTTLAAQGIAINTCSLTFQLPDGVSIAVCNRVGNLLGQARARRAKLTAWLGIAIGASIGVATLVLAILIASWWGSVYSNDKQVVACLVALMPACATFQMLDAVNSLGSGVLRSLGRQNAGALINFPSYYLVGFPFGLYLTYGGPDIGVVGLWYGIIIGVALAVLMQILIFVRTSWRNEVQKCMERVSKDSLSFANDDDDADSNALNI
ncbi:ethionine resistance protein [Coemansia sp. RSA 1813]|nr:ethionine resistance protein [Coemansia sp. RSA 1843]KAJ2212001.1 ethionine resistance protein [Coemansia sp. RSA 487]KAJ2565953.1 ethionine resistance protein [Coemansia sp. RSA 1813]